MSNMELGKDNILISRELAVKIGINEAILLQEIHSKAMQSTHKYEGYRWVRSSAKEWNADIPFMSLKTVERTISSLKKKRLVCTTTDLNIDVMDRTNWYRVNYPELEIIMDKN